MFNIKLVPLLPRNVERLLPVPSIRRTPATVRHEGWNRRYAAWSLGSCAIGDIGTGTGLIALMMAQRFPEAEVTGIDIDEDAVTQAVENVRLSPFSERVRIYRQDIVNFTDIIGFDAIVSNPPYFVDSLACPDDQRTIARHAVSLTYEQLMHLAYHLLKDEGRFSVVVPSDCRAKIEATACLEGFFTTRVCLIKTTPRKQPKRQLIEFQKHPVSELDISEGVIEVSPNVRSGWYQQLTKEFYIK